jgi:hypothetical protein
MPRTLEVFDMAGLAVESRDMSHEGIKLIRPDGYVAYETSHANHASALAPISSLLQRIAC